MRCSALDLEFMGSKGSHRIYQKGEVRVVVPFHSGATLHPKIVKQVLEIVEGAGKADLT